MTPPADPSNGDVDPRWIAELRRLARSRPTSGRAAAAKASAMGTLERLGRERRRQEVPPMPEGWYTHEPGDPFYELDRVLLREHRRSCGAIGKRHGATGECESPRGHPSPSSGPWLLLAVYE